MTRKDKFYIAQIEEEKKPERKQSKYVSPYSGTSAKDEYVYPYVKYDNGGKQYQGLKDKEELDTVFVESETPDQMKKRKELEDKYSPDRIPSYYRKEENLGINSTNLADLRGDKLSNEEILERNRREYGRFYHQAMRDYDTKKETPKPIVEEEKKSSSFGGSVIVDSLNSEKYNSYQEPDYSFNSEKEEPVKQTFEDYSYKKSDENVYSYVKNDRVNQDVDFFHLDEPKKEEEYPRKNAAPSYFDHQERFDAEEVVVEEPVRETRVRQTFTRPIEKPKESKDMFFGNAKKKYVAPPIEILQRNGKMSAADTDEINYQISTINRTLEEFKVGGKVIDYTKGPTVTQFEIKLDPGVNVNKVVNLQKNLQMSLASDDIRIEAPIPRKSTVGIEVPNITRDVVLFGDMITDERYLKDGKPLNIILGLNISGHAQYADISKMPHALVAGKTGGGKSVCIFSIIFSILYKSSPEEVKLVLIDPKGNELIFFQDIPHLATPIITGVELVAPALKWVVDEMERRYEFLATHRKRTVEDYNVYAKANGLNILPYIVVLIDEFGDLMTYIADAFETYVLRLAQKARSAGIHVIIATQRPTVDVIKGNIKANIASRIAFTTSSPIDSQTILDRPGAEKLLEKGDMLYLTGGHMTRVQGTYISEQELEAISQYYYEQNITPNYMFSHEELKVQAEEDRSNSTFAGNTPFEDEYFEDVARFVFRQRKASANQIQKTFMIGFNRADKIIAGLADLGIIESENIPGRARSVLINDVDELENLLRNRF